MTGDGGSGCSDNEEVRDQRSANPEFTLNIQRVPGDVKIKDQYVSESTTHSVMSLHPSMASCMCCSASGPCPGSWASISASCLSALTLRTRIGPPIRKSKDRR